MYAAPGSELPDSDWYDEICGEVEAVDGSWYNAVFHLVSVPE